ncbi:DUF6069 family protein [Streptomyces sp. MNU76]|uniref:DUF6069 family protein n=1 Tax=Streptomyces sp. MNU76 TaxID=2560026 RepID=UPI001E5D99FC|nr:DUF6069 family protein [Streptomyces sp. MNU76]MCC9711522.1 DUF6069 family protein [Streptomyces sp. MNU76]
MSARRRRLGVTALAVLAPVLVWLVADPLLGHRLRIADGEQTLDIGAVPVAGDDALSKRPPSALRWTKPALLISPPFV